MLKPGFTNAINQLQRDPRNGLQGDPRYRLQGDPRYKLQGDQCASFFFV